MTQYPEAIEPMPAVRCRRRVAMAVLLAGLSACGRKGALYMPDEEPDARRLPRSTTPGVPPGTTTPDGQPLPPLDTERLPDIEDE